LSGSREYGFGRRHSEFAAPVTGTYPLQIIRHMDVSNDSSLKFTTGKPTQQRHLSILLGKNVNAGRLLAGFTVSDPGNWTSWPPHEHAALLEEMYVYFDMPEPALSETTAGSWWVPRPEKL
jgi:5-deoxy-glucuronate isomerase